MIKVEFNTPFKEQLAFFRSKGFKASPDSWRDVWQQAHARAFTVARVTSMDVLEDVRGAIDKAMVDGTSLREFKKTLRPTLERKGWLKPVGEKAEITLSDGTVRKRLTGWRLDTIFNSNMGAAYSAGRYKQQQEVKDRRPYWQYMTAGDVAVRDEHADMAGRVWHADHPVWDEWYPQNGFGCRCYVKTVSERQMNARGLVEETSGVDIAPDEGWRYNPGKAGLDAWKPDMRKYPEAVAEQLKRELGKRHFRKIETPEEIEDFVANRDDLPKHLRPFVTPYTAQEYLEEGMEAFMTPGGDAGYALKQDGDLVSVFSKAGAHKGADVVKHALARGAKKLDCFDGYLPEFYDNFGFREYDRWKWAEQHAPKAWDYTRFGRPDVVLMRIKEAG